MPITKRGLSRGLNSLLSERAKNLTQEPARINITNVSKDGELRYIPLDKLQRGRYQPRDNFSNEHLQSLADSIRVQGVLQPIIVRKIAEHAYEIIAGERRWRAAQLAGLNEIPALIRTLADEPALAVALIENIQREDLNALEEANALHRLIDEFGLSQQAVAEAVGKSRTAITNSLRLLKLNPEVKTLLQNGELDMGHARALLALEGLLQSHTAKQIVAKKLSVRETEKLVRQLLTEKKSSAKQGLHHSDPNVRRVEIKLAETLGAKVAIHHAGKGGKVEIYYHSLDELEGILEHIK